MYGLTRGTITLLGAALAGFLIWLASQVDGGTTGGYWSIYGLLAAAVLVAKGRSQSPVTLRKRGRSRKRRDSRRSLTRSHERNQTSRRCRLSKMMQRQPKC